MTEKRTSWSLLLTVRNVTSQQLRDSVPTITFLTLWKVFISPINNYQAGPLFTNATESRVKLSANVYLLLMNHKRSDIELAI